MSTKKILLFMFLLGCVITTMHLLLISGVHIFWYTTTGLRLRTPIYQLFRWPLHGFISVLPTLIFIKSDGATKLGWRVRIVVHFFLTIVFTLGSWILFWYGAYDSWNDLFRSIVRGYYNIFFLMFTVIYGGAYLTFVSYQKRLANRLNEKIQERKRKEAAIYDVLDVEIDDK